MDDQRDWTQAFIVMYDEDGKAIGHGTLPQWKAEKLVEAGLGWQLVTKNERAEVMKQIEEKEE